jgi:excisionase family DNA binding protein
MAPSSLPDGTDSPTPNEPTNFLKAGEVAARLNVTEQTVRLWCRTGILPAYRPRSTRQWLIEPTELQAWLNKSAVASTMEFLQAPYRELASDEEIATEFLKRRHEPTDSAVED